MLVTVIVKTGVREEGVSYDDETQSYLVSVKARPIEGEANKAIIVLLAKYLKTPKTNVTLKSGTKSKVKRFEVS